MTKVPIEKNSSNKENDIWNELNGRHSKLKNRRTLSFISTSRRRTSHFGTLKNNLKNRRRLSLSQPAKKFVPITNSSKANSEHFLSLTSIKNHFKKCNDESKHKQFEIKSASKKLSFKTNKQKHLGTEFNFDTLFSHDKHLGDYLKNHFNSKNFVLNEELNNKIDLEIRILDGILKLLNAICSNTTLISNSSLSNLSTNSALSNGTIVSVSASSLISNLDVASLDDEGKCSSLGAKIAAALTCSKGLNESNQIQSDNPAFDINSPEYNHVIQILTACKCLFVSHRKIAIFLKNLQELEKKSADYSLDFELDKKHDLFSALDVSTSTVKNSTFLHEKTFDFDSCKLVLSEIRIPLSWKWTDYLKASKNSESVNCKFAAFAVIFLGNMVYDTQLLSNIDASITDIFFQESFTFDDVRPTNFEITIELYAYELYNTSNNLLQSARKLAKQFTDFASFKRHSTNQNGTNQNVLSQMPNLFNNALTNSTNTYSYSMNKFKLIARAVLRKSDISEETGTRPLQIISDLGTEGLANTSFNLDLSGSGQSAISNIFSSNKLPLFDYFSCKLKTLSTSSFI